MTTITNCAPRYVDVSCPPYSVTAAMTPAQQRVGIQQAWDDVSALGGGIVVLPDMYTVDRSPGSFFCLRVRDNVRKRLRPRVGPPNSRGPFGGHRTRVDNTS